MSAVSLNLLRNSTLYIPIHWIILVIADVSDIVNAPQFSWGHVSIRKSVLLSVIGGLPIPVIRTVVAPLSLEISKAFILKVLVPRCENTTIISFLDITWLDLTKSKLWIEYGVIEAAVLYCLQRNSAILDTQ
jgi:hypothetical protein